MITNSDKFTVEQKLPRNPVDNMERRILSSDFFPIQSSSGSSMACWGRAPVLSRRDMDNLQRQVISG